MMATQAPAKERSIKEYSICGLIQKPPYTTYISLFNVDQNSYITELYNNHTNQCTIHSQNVIKVSEKRIQVEYTLS